MLFLVIDQQINNMQIILVMYIADIKIQGVMLNSADNEFTGLQLGLNQQIITDTATPGFEQKSLDKSTTNRFCCEFVSCVALLNFGNPPRNSDIRNKLVSWEKQHLQVSLQTRNTEIAKISPVAHSTVSFMKDIIRILFLTVSQRYPTWELCMLLMIEKQLDCV